MLPPAELDQWRRLEIYRQRYPIEKQLQPLLNLENSIRRRGIRSAALSRRLEELEEQVTEVRGELAAIEMEISGSRAAGSLLIEEIIDRVRVDRGEAWSPVPIRGFRVWRIQDNSVRGNQVEWSSPALECKCLREVPGEDLPHAVGTCGPPACGIYAVKSLSKFGNEFPTRSLDRSVVGVVAMTGKVVEHEDGYRSQFATVIAAVARYGELRLMTDDPRTIEDLFDDPFETLARSARDQYWTDDDAREFLECVQSKEERWI